MAVNRDKIIGLTRDHVRRQMEGEGTGHDWWHIDRVCRNALYIARREGADHFIVECAALLHDIADWKFCGGDDEAGRRRAGEWLQGLAVPQDFIEKIGRIVSEVSFKGHGVDTSPSTLEGEVVQDADRLDALGAIGIARTFAYGGHKGNPLHEPDLKPHLHRTFDEYKQGSKTTVLHFHEKLLLLRDRMNTPTGRKLATERHDFMQLFLQRFQEEWEGPVRD